MKKHIVQLKNWILILVALLSFGGLSKDVKAVKTITKASTTKFKNKKLKKKKTYYYKVRAIKKAGKKVTYSKYSKAVSVKIKK